MATAGPTRPVVTLISSVDGGTAKAASSCAITMANEAGSPAPPCSTGSVSAP
jgi:hypothetical protein